MKRYLIVTCNIVTGDIIPLMFNTGTFNQPVQYEDLEEAEKHVKDRKSLHIVDLLRSVYDNQVLLNDNASLRNQLAALHLELSRIKKPLL